MLLPVQDGLTISDVSNRPSIQVRVLSTIALERGMNRDEVREVVQEWMAAAQVRFPVVAKPKSAAMHDPASHEVLIVYRLEGILKVVQERSYILQVCVRYWSSVYYSPKLVAGYQYNVLDDYYRVLSFISSVDCPLPVMLSRHSDVEPRGRLVAAAYE